MNKRLWGEKAAVSGLIGEKNAASGLFGEKTAMLRFLLVLFLFALVMSVLGCGKEAESERALPVIYISENGAAEEMKSGANADKNSLNNSSESNCKSGLEIGIEDELENDSEADFDDASEAENEVDFEAENDLDDEAADKLEDSQNELSETDEAIETDKATKTDEATKTEVAESHLDWVRDLKAAANHDQIITIVASASTATVSMHERQENGHFEEILSGSANIGKNGIGKSSEGDKKTPRGVLGILFAFGLKDNPGTALTYVKLDESHYWVDDSASNYYNKFVSTKEVTADWNSAEHMIEATGSYNYGLATDYNSSCIPGAGSAIFMHCRPTGGAGCIAVDEALMKSILKRIKPGCIIIVDTKDGVYNY